MKAKKVNNSWILRIEKNEKLIESLKLFCKNEKIFGGFFSGLGAVDKVELALYDVDKKKYISKKFNGSFELVNLTGSIGIEKELIIHAHATISNKKMQVFGGHLVEAIISGTAEIYIIKTPKLNKQLDPVTGLKLFSF